MYQSKPEIVENNL